MKWLEYSVTCHLFKPYSTAAEEVDGTRGWVASSPKSSAWFYKGSFLDLNESNVFKTECGGVEGGSRWRVDVTEGWLYDNIVVRNAPRLHFWPGSTFQLEYVIFPFKYDERVTTEHGTHRVDETIALMRTAYR